MSSRFPILLVDFPRPNRERQALRERLTAHHRRLRARSIGLEAPMNERGMVDLAAWEDLIARIQLYPDEEMRIERRAANLARRELERDGLRHLKPADRKRIEGLQGGARLVALKTEHQADELAAQLHAEFPWMAPATEQVWHGMRASVREGLPGLRLRPLLLHGPPGIGKSVWARRLAELIQTPSMTYEAAAESASFGLVGSQRAWSNSTPGRLVSMIVEHRVANPIVIVDEVEKAGGAAGSSGRSYDLTAAMLSLVEPATAQKWSCPFYEVPFDLSWVIWVMTSNNWRHLPEPLLSRCPPIRLPNLTIRDLEGFARREGARRGLSAHAIEAITEVLGQHSEHAKRLSLRSVIRSLELAAALENHPLLH